MSDLDDADYAIRAPYIQRILELEAMVAELEKLLAATSHKRADIPDTAPQPPEVLVSYRQKTWMT